MRHPDLAPMLEVRKPGDGHDVVRPEAAAAIEQMLGSRVVLPAVFDDPAACVHALARWSGGHMRHLFQIALHRSHLIVDTEQDRRMLANACVLTYGSASPWWDVHPAIWADRLFQVYEGEMG